MFNKFLSILFILTILSLCCNTTKTINEKKVACYGLANQEQHNKNYSYAVDEWNLLGAILFVPVGTVFIPLTTNFDSTIRTTLFTRH